MAGPNSAVGSSDGSLNFRRGVNSIKVTTVASPTNPDGLARDELAWLINGSVRDGGITTRHGYALKGRVHSADGLYQGGWMYMPLPTSIGFRVMLQNLDGAAGGTISAGASNGPLGPNFTTFAVPTIFSFVVVTTTQAYAGSIGDTISVGGINWKVLGFNTALTDTMPYIIESISGHIWKVPVDNPAGAIDLSVIFNLYNPPDIEQAHMVQGEEFLVIQAGDNVTLPLFWDNAILRRSSGIFAPGVLTGTGYTLIDTIALTGWTVPVTGQTNTITLNAPYPGAIGDAIKFNSAQQPAGFGGNYKVTASVGNVLTLQKVDFNAQAYLIGNLQTNVLAKSSNPTASASELPAAGPMDYFEGRIWYAQGSTYIGGDIVGNTSSGTLAYHFRDAILRVTENPLAIGGDGFSVPANAGNIRALAHSSVPGESAREGQLFALTRKAIYGLRVPISRNDWIAANSNNQPIQTIVQLVNGSVGDRCVVPINGDLFYQSLEPAIRSLIFALRFRNQWGDKDVSSNEHRIMQFNDRELLHGTSGIAFNNRLLMTALPVQKAQGIAHQAIIPLDFLPISSFGETGEPCWNGMYEGLDILQLFVGDFGGRERAFAMVVSRTDGGMDLWELTDYLRTDMNLSGESRTTMIIEWPAFTQNKEFEQKKLVGAELWVDRIYGEVIFHLEYRPDGDSCWHHWHQWKVCSAKNSAEDVTNPTTYPLTPYAENFRQTMSVPMPPDGCQTASARPLNIGYQFQPRLTVTGWCRVRGILLHMQPVEQPLYGDGMVC